MNRLLSVFILFLISLPSVFAEGSCKYQGEISECIEAVKSYTKKDGWYIAPWASLREITDYPCLQAAPEQIAFQIIMHKNHEIIDKEMDKYLWNLSDNKNQYFWPEAQFTYFEWLNHIRQKAAEFNNRYKKACDQTISDAFSCVSNPLYKDSQDKSQISINQARDYFSESNWSCAALSDVKTEIFIQVSYDILLLNQQQILRDEKKLYDQEIRTKYDGILDLMALNLSYIGNILQQLTAFLKNTL